MESCFRPPPAPLFGVKANSGVRPGPLCEAAQEKANLDLANHFCRRLLYVPAALGFIGDCTVGPYVQQ